VTLNRPDMLVKSKELKAFLAESGSDSSLEKAFADGAVEIHSRSKEITRDGTGEHAEYYTDEQKVILRGPLVKMQSAPPPKTSQGIELIWWANDDRLLVNGTPEKPVDTRVLRKKKGK
jgi:hypothetical protein